MDNILEISERIDELEELLNTFVSTASLFYDQNQHLNIMTLTKDLLTTIHTDETLSIPVKNSFYGYIAVIHSDATDRLAKDKKLYNELFKINKGDGMFDETEFNS